MNDTTNMQTNVHENSLFKLDPSVLLNIALNAVQKAISASSIFVNEAINGYTNSDKNILKKLLDLTRKEASEALTIVKKVHDHLNDHEKESLHEIERNYLINENLAEKINIVINSNYPSKDKEPLEQLVRESN